MPLVPLPLPPPAVAPNPLPPLLVEPLPPVLFPIVHPAPPLPPLPGDELYSIGASSNLGACIASLLDGEPVL